MTEGNKFDQNQLLKYLSIEGEERYLALEVFRSLEGYSHLYPQADVGFVAKPFAYLLNAVRSLQGLDDNGDKKDDVKLMQRVVFTPEVFMEVLSLAQEDALDERESYVFMAHYGINEQAKTMAEIGVNLAITRERVRQLLNRAIRRILIKGKRQILQENYESPCATLISGINTAILFEEDGATERILDFIESNLSHIPLGQALTLICYLLFQKEPLSTRYKKSARDVFNQRVADKKAIARQENIRARLEIRLNDVMNYVVWPKEAKIVALDSASYLDRARDVNKDGDGNSGYYFSDKLRREVQYESELELSFFEMLEASPEVIFYQEQPFSIPYAKDQKLKNYFPDVFFITKNNQCVVAEIKPYFQMALQNNLIKWTALKKFCIEHGYGMLVTDGGRSIQEVMRHEVNQKFSEKILSVLSDRNLTWQEYKEIRNKFNVKYIDFMALVLKERLVWQLSPFKLSKQSL